MVCKSHLEESRVETEKKEHLKNVKKKNLCVLGFSKETESIDVCVYYYIIAHVYNLFL